jgi:hypothetical protein
MTWVQRNRLSAGVVLGLLAGIGSYSAESQQGTNRKTIAVSGAVTQTDAHPDVPLPPLPPAPSGKATVMGGAIRSLDPVRDQFSLKVSGGGSVKILFDERTQFFRDGVRLPLRALRPADHASVETVLDGTSIYALSVHMLSAAPQGDIQGQVVNYDAKAQEMTVESRLSTQPLRLHVPESTPVTCVGQASPGECSSLADIRRGVLVNVKFQSDNTGRGVANEIGIMATPGSTYVLTGDLAALNLPGGLLVVMDPRDNKQYSVQFRAADFPVVSEMHEGMHVAVTATFDGLRYTATAIKAR